MLRPEGQSTQAPILGYGHAGSRTRRRLLRAVAALLVLAPILWVVWRFGPEWWNQYRFLAAQRACARYTAPVGQLVFDAPPGFPGPTPLGFIDLRPTKASPSGGRLQKVGFARAAPDCWTKWTERWRIGPATAILVSVGVAPVTPLFLHARRTPTGGERIVVVPPMWIAQQNSADVQWAAACNALVPGTRIAPPRLGSARYFSLFLKPDQHLRVFAGQPDPADATHFTLPYDVDGTPGTIDGHLLDDDANPVDLKVRRGSPGGDGGLWLFPH